MVGCLCAQDEKPKVPSRLEATLPSLTRSRTGQLEDEEEKSRALMHSKSKSIYDLVYG